MPGGCYVCSAALKSPGGINDAREVAQGSRSPLGVGAPATVTTLPTASTHLPN
jgi:hypothetical protein